MTELNGITADRVSVWAWALSSFFAGLAGVLIAPRSRPSRPRVLQHRGGRHRRRRRWLSGSLPRAFVGGLGLGVLIALFNTFIPKWSNDFTWLQPIQNNLTPAIPFIVLFGVLVFAPNVRRSRRATDPLSGVDPPAASQANAVENARSIMIRRLLGTAALIAAGAVLFTKGDSVWIFLATQGVVLAVVFLSITVMTGFAGHISLCQGAFAAIGAFTVYQLATRYDTPVLVGTLIGGVIAAVVGRPAVAPLLRLNGIWIAIATLSFAFFFNSVMVKFSWVGGSATDAGSALTVPRPLLGPWDFDNDKVFLLLAIMVLTIATLP